MKLESDKPAVQLTVNGIPAFSVVDISYEYKSDVSIALNSATLTGKDLAFTLSAAVSDVSDIQEVLLYGSLCSNVAVTNSPTNSEFSCQFETLNAGKDQSPRVLVKNIGFATSTQTIDSPLTISSMAPAAAGVNGGVEATISGTGFPAPSVFSTYTDDNTFEILVCGNKVEDKNVLSITN